MMQAYPAAVFTPFFHTKDGVLAELTEFMFENQFGVAEKIHWNREKSGASLRR